MAGIYIHIPFCRKACHYCNFHFSTSFAAKDALIHAIVTEIALRRDYLSNEEIGTIYFGGGTPSALPPEDISNLLQALRKHHSFSARTEITLEANPDDVTREQLDAWMRMGINRLSIGIQALQPDLLLAWNRSHTVDQALLSIGLVQNAGLSNITADLIYGGPGLSDADWRFNIQTLMDYNIPHISSYALTVETGTALFHHIKTGRTPGPDDEQANRQYAILREMLASHAYVQYEVSNFAKPGFVSRHNTSYWNGISYLGLGPSAHSYDGVSRQWNISNNVRYTESIQSGTLPVEREILTLDEKYNELVMTGLRTSAGIDLTKIKSLGEQYVHHLLKRAEHFLRDQKVILKDKDRMVLDPEFYFFADGMASDLFVLSPAGDERM